MNRRMLLLTLLTAGLVSAQVSLPQVGNLRDANRSWRGLRGIAGNFLLDVPIVAGVAAGVSNGAISLIATDDPAIVVLDSAGATIGRASVSQPPALLAVSPDGTLAAAWQPSCQTLSIWHSADGQWQDFAYQTQGAILALSIDSAAGLWVVQRDNTHAVSRLNLQLSDFSVQGQQSLPIDADLVQVTTAGQVLWIAGDGQLHWLDRDGNETVGDAPAGLKQWAAIGRGWWQAVDDAGRQWSLLLRLGQTPQWFALPSATEVAQ